MEQAATNYTAGAGSNMTVSLFGNEIPLYTFYDFITISAMVIFTFAVVDIAYNLTPAGRWFNRTVDRWGRYAAAVDAKEDKR